MRERKERERENECGEVTDRQTIVHVNIISLHDALKVVIVVIDSMESTVIHIDYYHLETKRELEHFQNSLTHLGTVNFCQSL